MPTTLYAKAAGGNWSAAGTWSSTGSGGGDSSGPPTASQNVVFEAGSGNVTIDAASVCRSLDCTSGTGNYAGTLTQTSTFSLSIGDGSAGPGNVILKLSSGMTFAGGWIINIVTGANGSVTCNGVTIPSQFRSNAPGVTVTLADAFLCSSGLVLDAGTLTASAAVTANSFSSSNSNVRTLNMGSATWNLTATGIVWQMPTVTNLTLNAQTSTIKVTNTSNSDVTLNLGGQTYNNLWLSRGASTGNIIFTGSNTFADFKDDGSAGHALQFTNGTTQTVTTWHVSGSSGNVITINSTSTATHALTKSGAGLISSDYLNIQHSVATPSDTWYAGANSTNNQGVATSGSGWIFTVPTRTTSDAPTTTDAVVRVRVATRSPSDAPTVSTSVGIAAGSSFARTASDTPTTTDAAVVVKGSNRSLSDSPHTTDSITRLFVGARTLSDAPTTIDSLAYEIIVGSLPIALKYAVPEAISLTYPVPAAIALKYKNENDQ